jgi:hypothetical protein
MFTNIYESDPIPYAKLGDPSITQTYPLYGFYPELVTPPRQYAEELLPIVSGLWVNNEGTASSHSTITLLSQTRQYYSPITPMRWWKFDSMTGKFVERSKLGDDDGQPFGGAWQMRDGSLYGTPANKTPVYQLDAVNGRLQHHRRARPAKRYGDSGDSALQRHHRHPARRCAALLCTH